MSFPSFTQAKKDAVESLKKLLTNQPILALSRKTGQYTIYTYAYDSQVVCVLLQKQEEGTIRPSEYCSRTLTRAEQKLATTNKEFLAMVWAVLLQQPYLGLSYFIIHTDHEGLNWLLMSADASGKLESLRLRLLEFDF